MEQLIHIGRLREELLLARTLPQVLSLDPPPDVSDLFVKTKTQMIEEDVQSHINTWMKKRKRSDPMDDSQTELTLLKDVVESAELKSVEEYEALETPPVALKSYTCELDREFRAATKLRVQDKNYLASEEFQSHGSSQVSDALIVAVAMYHPATGKKAQELLFTSFQRLTDLKASIYCLSDHMDLRDDSQSEIPPYFLIEDKKLSNLDICFSALSVRLKTTYKYVHRSGCEHIILITDLRLATDQDAPNLSDYPRLIFTSKTKRKKCEVCRQYHACFITINDPISPKRMCLMCEFCFKNLHYGEDGELVYSDFKVLPYLHD